MLLRYKDGCKGWRGQNTLVFWGSVVSDPKLKGKSLVRPHVRQMFRRPRGYGWGPELGIGDRCYYLKVTRR